MALLVKFNKDWADEFDVEGFKIYKDRAEFDEALGDISELTFSFGTNEGWEEPGEFDLSDFTFVEISDEEAAVLTKLFGREYGNFPL